jgi:hypothetical protein
MGHGYPQGVRVGCVVVVVAACKAAPAPAPTIANRAPLEPPAARKGCTIYGTVTDAATHEPLAGVTLVASGDDDAVMQTAISDERGKFLIKLDAPQRTLDVYYVDATLQRPLTRCDQQFVLQLEQSGSIGPIHVW